MAVHRQTWCGEVESSISGSTGSRKGGGTGLGPWNLKAYPSDTPLPTTPHLFQRGHTNSVTTPCSPNIQIYEPFRTVLHSYSNPTHPFHDHLFFLKIKCLEFHLSSFNKQFKKQFPISSNIFLRHYDFRWLHTCQSCRWTEGCFQVYTIIHNAELDILDNASSVTAVSAYSLIKSS